jgi:hypothetical protein
MGSNPIGDAKIEVNMANCKREPLKDSERCQSKKAVLMSEHARVQCDSKIGHHGKHRAEVSDKNVDKAVEWQ